LINNLVLINQAQPINKTKTNSKIHRLAFEITSYMCVYGADLVAILGSGRASCGAGPGAVLGGMCGGGWWQRWPDGVATDPTEQK